VSVENGHELLTANLAVIERAIRFAARRYRLTPEDAQDFEGIVKLKLVENDYAILAAYEQRSGFSTFIGIVVQRMALDYRVHLWGRWHPSAEAKRLGPLAVQLEQLLHRDGRTLDDAVVLLREEHDGVTRESLAALADKLPPRPPRHREVELEAATPVAVTANIDEPALADDRRRSSQQLSVLMAAILEQLPEDDRLILQLRFEGGMSVAQIARSLMLDQKLTYRRIERSMREMRRELERAGIDSRVVADVIGRDEVLVHFDFGNRKSRPSIARDESAQAQPEETA
jgi:RNA polymerase sigma factor for flagellar operon FliA